MENNLKRPISDWTVFVLGVIGFLMGIMGIINPDSQYKMLGLNPSADSTGLVMKGLLTSSSVSAIYVGILYVFGVWKRWPKFKNYLVFTRTLMAIAFLILITCSKTVDAFKSAAIWEGAGAVLILLSLLWDPRKVSSRT